MFDSPVITAKTSTSPVICKFGGSRNSVRVYNFRTQIFHKKLLIILHCSNIPLPDVHFCYMGNFLHTMIYKLTGISFT